MKSTGYIIELLVAGAGTVLWLGILLLALFGHQWLPTAMFKEAEFLIIASPFIYALGVIMDRNIDELFDEFRTCRDMKRREEYFTKGEVSDRYKNILAEEEKKIKEKEKEKEKEEAKKKNGKENSDTENQKKDDSVSIIWTLLCKAKTIEAHKKGTYNSCVEALVKDVEEGNVEVVDFSLPIQTYHEIRTKIMVTSETLATQLEYYKIRLRISRTWAVNAFLTLIAANLWIILPHTPILKLGLRIQACMAITVVLGLSVWMAWRAWAQLTKKEIKFLWQQVRILNQMEKGKSDPSSPATLDASD